jgi:hypothetical protein
VELEALAEIERPALAVVGARPALRDAGTDAALLEIEPDERVPDRGVVVRVRRPRIRNGVHDLGAESVQRNDQRVLVLGTHRRRAGHEAEHRCDAHHDP